MAALPLGHFLNPVFSEKNYSIVKEKTTELGRIFTSGTKAYGEPDSKSKIVNQFDKNSIVKLKEAVNIQNGQEIQPWYRLTDDSFILSYDFQPVQDSLNAVRTEIKKSGMIAEITVPFTDAWTTKKTGSRSNQVFYYGSTHWVFGLGQDEAKNYYYLVKEDRWNNTYYINATHLRIIPDSELMPISELTPLDEKHIQVDLQAQSMTAYEKDDVVFTSPIASGQLSGDVDLTTPPGDYMINYKRPSRHMAHTDRMGDNGGELFGVPWVSYFTNTGIAFHGTYWHNNFTKPRSHGCINLPIPAAKWVYLWTQPVVPPTEQTYVSRYGTKVEVI
jgi:hypothetical protein